MMQATSYYGRSAKVAIQDGFQPSASNFPDRATSGQPIPCQTRSHSNSADSFARSEIAQLPEAHNMQLGAPKAIAKPFVSAATTAWNGCLQSE
jgi:hypothetical protein